MTREPGVDDDELELDLDETVEEDFEAAAREAVAAIEAVEAGRAGSAEATVEEPAATPADETPTATAGGEAEELRNQLLRTLADFENYRKRTDRERDELRQTALFAFLRDFLPVMDNLDRALGAGGSYDDLRRGVEMIHRQMADLLRQQGVEDVAARGQRFDPVVHEAVARVEGQEPFPVVVDELQRGYRLRGRLLRPALVRVAVPRDNLGSEESVD